MSKGWHHEPSRHALAARGIRTKTTGHTTVEHILDEKWDLGMEPTNDDDIIIKTEDNGDIAIYYLSYDTTGGDIDDYMGDGMGRLISGKRGEASRKDIEIAKEAMEHDPYAVIVSCYEHGNQFWFLPENRRSFHDRWDTAEVAGVWIPDDNLRSMIMKESTDADRKKAARKFAQQYLDQYNSILGGDVYIINRDIFHPGERDPFDSDSVGGYIGHDWAKTELEDTARRGGF